MKLTTTTQVPVDRVAQGNGGPDENRSGGFERGGWTRPLFDSQAITFVNQVYQRAGAFLFGRRTYEIFGSGALTRWLLASDLVDEMNLLVCPVVVGQGTRLFPDTGPDQRCLGEEPQRFRLGARLHPQLPQGRRT